MKFKNVFFRKMTILYSLIIGILLIGIYFVFTLTVSLGEKIDSGIRDQHYVITYATEQTSIKGAKILERVKTAKYLVKEDSSLTGNECYANSMYYYHRNIGDEVSLTHDDSVKCVINDFKKSGEDLYNYLVSKETYDSIKEEGYSYLVSINSYDDLSRLENSDEVLSLSIYEIGVDYYEKRLQYETNIYFIIGAVILLLLIGVVIFFNTKGYILANTKKTKKKDNTLLLTVCSTILTIVNGYVTGSLIALILILLTEL